MIVSNDTFILYKIGKNSLIYRLVKFCFIILLILIPLSALLHILYKEINLFMGTFAISMVLLIINSVIGSFISPNAIDIGYITFYEDQIEINSSDEEKQYLVEDINEIVISIGGYKGQMISIMSFSTIRGLNNYAKLILKENNQSKKYTIKLMNVNQFYDLREIKKYYKEKMKK